MSPNMMAYGYQEKSKLYIVYIECTQSSNF
jgi:hypothetical protein